VWYHSEPSDFPYFPNQFLGLDFSIFFEEWFHQKLMKLMLDIRLLSSLDFCLKWSVIDPMMNRLRTLETAIGLFLSVFYHGWLSANLGPHFLCWISGVAPFNMWLISKWEENKYGYKLSNWQNDNYFHSKWQLWPFSVK
jgi:hypothetical protein